MIPATADIINNPTSPQTICCLPVVRLSSLSAFQINSTIPQIKTAIAIANISPIKGFKIPVITLLTRLIKSRNDYGLKVGAGSVPPVVTPKVEATIWIIPQKAIITKIPIKP